MFLNSMQIISSKEVFKNKLFTIVDEVAHDLLGFHVAVLLVVVEPLEDGSKGDARPR